MANGTFTSIPVLSSRGAAELPSRIHLIGAGGAGLSGAGRLLVARGHVLSGHDRDPSPFTRALSELGVPLALGASTAGDLPDDTEAVVRSAAVGEDDPQVALAIERGLPVFKYSELLGALAPPRRTLAVAGTHGKTTSAWMLYHALAGVGGMGTGAGAPGALIGGVDRLLGTNAVAPGEDGWFACEACEYDRSFLALAPRGAIVTNVEADHLDCFGTLEALEQAFARFADRIHPDGLLVCGPDVPERVMDAAACRVWRLGRELHLDLLSERRGRFEMRLRGPGWATPRIQLGVPGEFNTENAALALALAIGLAAHEDGPGSIELAAERAAHAVGRFAGAARRFEPWGQIADVDVVHDYAHHPTEVAATLEAARRVFPGVPLHVLFQPHQASRTARFLDDFVEALRAADHVVVSDVYGARKHIDSEGAGAQELVARLVRAGVDATHGGPVQDAGRLFRDRLGSTGAALVLGAGDIDGIRDELLDPVALRRDS
ncbi:MAG: UDP-N-acetylmuramate--L-alanine ligase [bacterium]|nr:UDP-N-acetylmuramate--L-alanine ligase [bacterium]